MANNTEQDKIETDILDQQDERGRFEGDYYKDWTDGEKEEYDRDMDEAFKEWSEENRYDIPDDDEDNYWDPVD